MVAEFKSLLDLVKAFPAEADCISHLETIRWAGNVLSPFDESSKVYKTARGYKCKNTGKYFNVKVGTIFEDTKIPLIKWFMALYIFSSHKKGISSHQLAKDIDVTQKSAWFILHRLRYAFEHPDFHAQLENIVEVDETYVGGKDKNKHENKKSGGRGRGTGKAPVIGMIERGGNVIAKAVDNTTKESIENVVHEFVEYGSTIITDEYNAYNHIHTA